MAFKKTLVQRLFNISRTSTPALTNCRIRTTSSVQTLIPPKPGETTAVPDSGEDGFFRRFLQRRAIFQSATVTATPEFRSLPIGDKLVEKLRGMDIGRDRIRLDGLSPPATIPDSDSDSSTEGISVEDARKLLRVSQLETLKSKLREVQVQKSCISYSEFVEICVEGCVNIDQGLGFAKMLDQSGTVIVLGNVVFLRPQQETE